MPQATATYSDRFISDLKKLDRRQKILVFNRIEKIQSNPELGKPLHAPLNGFRSERLECYRIIYKYSGSTVEFAWLQHRDEVYR